VTRISCSMFMDGSLGEASAMRAGIVVVRGDGGGLRTERSALTTSSDGIQATSGSIL
jgi:hypothetical protein